MSNRPVKLDLSPPQMEIYDQAAAYNLTIGAQGSGKSFNIGIMSYFFIWTCPKMIGLIVANTYSQLSRATLKAVFDTWKEYFGLTEYNPKSNPGGAYVFGKQPPPHFIPHGYTLVDNNNNIYLFNGAVIFTASLDNYTAIEGIEVGWALADETADTAPEAISSVITGRLRQRGLCVATKPLKGFFPYCPEGHQYAGRPINPLFVFTKPAKVPWLNELFKLEQHREKIQSVIYDRDKYFHHFDGVRQVTIYSVYWNEHNLPADYISNRLALLEGSGLINSHIFGDPFSKTGGEFVTEFDPVKHIAPVTIDENYPIHLTLDFNAKPYMSGLVCQIVDCRGEWNGNTEWLELRVIDEYALKSPRNTAGHLARCFSDDYSESVDMGLFVYGDASGNNNLPISATKSLFDDFTTNLTLGYELRVPSQNPRFKAINKNGMGRKAFTNVIFAGSKAVRVLVHPRCAEFIADLTYCKEDANGAMEKKKNKEGVEERGHHLDAFQYFICHPKSLGYLAKMG